MPRCDVAKARMVLPILVHSDDEISGGDGGSGSRGADGSTAAHEVYVLRDHANLNLLAQLRDAMIDEEVFWHFSLQFHHVAAVGVISTLSIKCMF